MAAVEATKIAEKEDRVGGAPGYTDLPVALVDHRTTCTIRPRHA